MKSRMRWLFSGSLSHETGVPGGEVPEQRREGTQRSSERTEGFRGKEVGGQHLERGLRSMSECVRMYGGVPGQPGGRGSLLWA